MLIQQIHRYNTPLNIDGHLKKAVASVSSLVQVYLHLNVVCVYALCVSVRILDNCAY